MYVCIFLYMCVFLCTIIILCIFVYIYIFIWTADSNLRSNEEPLIRWLHIPNFPFSIQPDIPKTKSRSLIPLARHSRTPCIWFCIKVSLPTIAVLVRMLLKCQPSWGLSTPQTPNRETQEVSSRWLGVAQGSSWWVDDFQRSTTARIWFIEHSSFQCLIFIHYLHMEVSWIAGTPKSSIVYHGFSINHPFGGSHG